MAVLKPTKKDALLDLLRAVAQTEEYFYVWEQAARLNGYPLPRIDEVTTKAIQSFANINKEQMR